MRAFTARQRTTVLEAIEEQLLHQSLVETKQRKPLRPNPLAPWDLRVGNFRVFYEVVADEPDTVRILAVGQKRGSKLYIGGQEIEL